MLAANDVERRLIEWRIVTESRDALVWEALELGVSKNRVYMLSQISRTTIDRIIDDHVRLNGRQP